MLQRDLERWLDPGWRDWLIAWWEGYDLSSMRQKALFVREEQRKGAAKPATGTAIVDAYAGARSLESSQLDRNGQPVWSVDRVRGAERIWGRDLIGPGDAQWMVDAVRPFGLNPAKSVLDLTAGLGGRARALVGSYDTWVTGLEASPVLAALAMERSKMAGLSRKASVSAYDPECIDQTGTFDLIIGDRILHIVRDKAFFLDRLQACTKERGGILLYDYVIDGTPRSWEEWNQWRQQEPNEVTPWTPKRLSDELVQRNLDVRIVDDLTAEHREHILSRIRQLGDELENTQDTEDEGVLAGLARELSLWWNRLRVLGAGLSMFRFVVYKPAG